MTNNGQSKPTENAILSSSASEAAVAPSCYRLSVLSGALEVSARLKNADDLALILKVLEANKTLFGKEEPEKETVLKAAKTFANGPSLSGGAIARQILTP